MFNMFKSSETAPLIRKNPSTFDFFKSSKIVEQKASVVLDYSIASPSHPSKGERQDSEITRLMISQMDDNICRLDISVNGNTTADFLMKYIKRYLDFTPSMLSAPTKHNDKKISLEGSVVDFKNFFEYMSQNASVLNKNDKEAILSLITVNKSLSFNKYNGD